MFHVTVNCIINASWYNKYTILSRGITSVWNDGFVQILFADLCTVPVDKQGLFDNSSVVLVSTYCQLGILTSVSDSESTASGTTTDDKTATIRYKLETSPSGNNKKLAMIKYHMYYPIFMAYTGAAVISLTSYLYTV